MTQPASFMRPTSLVTVGCLAKTMSANSPTVKAGFPDRLAMTRHSIRLRPLASTTAWNSLEIKWLARASR